MKHTLQINQTHQSTTASSRQHPDRYWLQQIDGWVVAGTLTFSARLNQPDHQLVKSYFSLLNYHLNGEFDWRNVPVYWNWQEQNRNGGERLHVHFALFDYTPEWNCLAGSENQFASRAELLRWLKSNWKHGTSMIEPCGKKWIKYITRQDSMLCSCYSPPIHHLKRKALAGERACFFPWIRDGGAE